MSIWNPGRGCKKGSDGCLHCYIHKGDLKKNINIDEIVKTIDFFMSTEKLINGDFKITQV